jgi:argininosuccinate synthase
VRLYKGSAAVTGRRSPVSLFDADLSSFEDSATDYRQADATGFIRLQGLRLAPRR